MIETTVRDQYNQMAERYDRRWSRYLFNTLSFLKDWVAIVPESTVLDIGCGTGEFERLVLSEQPEHTMVGVDLSEGMLEMAQQKCRDYPHVSFQKASVVALPFVDRSFDVIVSASAFHYFDDPIAALKEMQRLLKPNGEIVILDWCKDYIMCQLYDVVLKRVDPAYRQSYTQAEFHHLLTQAGLVIDRAAKVRFGLAWELMIATAKTDTPL
ncbi:class I SAM-dependent methyltransferase [Leptolyngbya sp. FACHB-321]|uniref:class I SAM-dependent methyltransferase n=1 Tax=Leptolyngbya sp. FACHB-321 TaxID=2692807 RepID=UPI001683F4B0|nr:class I SAM-dependent methyltransferase [Leptolyngbya sp. FACHB-321]MBD2034920.1 class I SAM-dependent methyltransferase [Leptolyngbya sp. FACHB-321]